MRSESTVKGTKTPYRIPAIQLYIKDAIEGHKKVVQEKNKSLTGLKLYMVAKGAAIEEFTNFTVEQKAKYQMEADKTNEANCQD